MTDKLMKIAQKFGGKLTWESPSGRKWYFDFPYIDDALDFTDRAEKLADFAFLTNHKKER